MYFRCSEENGLEGVSNQREKDFLGIAENFPLKHFMAVLRIPETRKNRLRICGRIVSAGEFNA